MLLKPREAARCLAISERKLWGLTKRDEIPCVRIGRAVRYDPTDLTRWIEGQKVRRGRDILANLQATPYT